MKVDLKNIATEQQNASSYNIDRVSTVQMVEIINDNDRQIYDAIKLQTQQIADCIDLIYSKIKTQGRLVYIGAGTSGRIGVLDASEILPTYGVDGKVVGLIAGGDTALRHPIEGAEDDEQQVIVDLQAINFSSSDVLVGIGASGRTPYVVSGLKYARNLGALTIGLCMTNNSLIAQAAEHTIAVVTGPEVVTGSTRMKAGTATKLVLNMISSILMIKMGKVYHNLMVDVKATNTKLEQRCFNIVQSISGSNDEQLIWKTLEETNYHCPTTILMIMQGISKTVAEKLLSENDNQLAKIIQ